MRLSQKYVLESDKGDIPYSVDLIIDNIYKVNYTVSEMYGDSNKEVTGRLTFMSIGGQDFDLDEDAYIELDISKVFHKSTITIKIKDIVSIKDENCPLKTK